MLITFSLASPSLLTFSEKNQTMDVPMVKEEDLAGGIVLAIDVSASMGLRDVVPSRLETAKDVLVEFVQNSSEKVRFGVVAFDKEINSSLPLASDKENITSTINRLVASEAMPCLEEYTDIGYGLMTAVNLLTPYASSNKTYAIILASDGFANYGYPSPVESVLQAARKAKDIGVPVYTLHIARMGQDSNPRLMERVANETGGEFMESQSADALKDILDIVGKYYAPTHTWSEKVEIKVTIPSRMELGSILMLGAAAVVIGLWIGNYKHYKTSF